MEINMDKEPVTVNGLQNLKKELEYFKMRSPSRIYVSKSFPYLKFRNIFTNEKRFVKKFSKRKPSMSLLK